jgi:aspartyl-tRNA(Asn)/glutamyl-tRNA(Gln) amidotransferase subunit B
MTTTTPVDRAIDLEPVIGLEVHVQLLTRSKMFCSCSADYTGAEPNTRVCPVCLGMPGTLPVINRQAVTFTVMTALALNCEISTATKFDRKNYPYPDLMKGYQISQFDMPLSHDGWLEIESEGDGSRRRAGITRVHLEEDTARLTHRLDVSGDSYSLVDINRSGVPLMEVVGEPDLQSADEAHSYLTKLRTILRYLGVSTGNMDEGSFRCDANISMRKQGDPLPQYKVEVKNMNSFRAVHRALEFEIKRQTQLMTDGEPIAQETRGWVEETGETVSQRSKEYAHDYRYFPEPDLPPMNFSREWVEEIRQALPELPDARRDRFQDEHALSKYDSSLLTATRSSANFFEAALAASSYVKTNPAVGQGRPKALANWIVGDLAHLLDEAGLEVADSPVSATALAEMLDLMDDGKISVRMAKDVFESMFKTSDSPAKIVEERDLSQISDEDALLVIVRQVIENNPKALADFQNGKSNVVGFLVGQVMRETRGQANPGVANELVARELATAS